MALALQDEGHNALSVERIQDFDGILAVRELVRVFTDDDISLLRLGHDGRITEANHLGDGQASDAGGIPAKVNDGGRRITHIAASAGTGGSVDDSYLPGNQIYDQRDTIPACTG